MTGRATKWGWSLLLLLAACARPPGTEKSAPPAPAHVAPNRAAGAGLDPEPHGPPRRATVAPASGAPLAEAQPAVECLRDDDCVVAPWALEDAPCCDAPYTAVQSKVVLQALGAFRTQSPVCREFDCSVPLRRFQGGPPPAPPAPCYFQPRCKGSRCGNSC